MNITPITVLAGLALLTGGSDKSSTQTTANNRDSQSPPPIQAEPFHGQVYKSLNGRTVLTLISKDECELAQGGTTLLCKYSKPNDTLRIVKTALGTSQVVYYRITSQGLEGNDGNVLLSPEGYASAVAQLEQQQRANEMKQERERLENQRVEEVIADSKIETRTVSKFPLATEMHVGLG